jgi:hypothetical protein
MIMFRKIQSKSNFAQVGIESTYGRIYTYTYDQLSLSVHTHTHTHTHTHIHTHQIFQLKSKLQHNGSPSTTARPPRRLLSPNSILPPLSSHCAFIPARKNSARFKNAVFSNLYFFKLASAWNCLNREVSVQHSQRKFHLHLIPLYILQALRNF